MIVVVNPLLLLDAATERELTLLNLHLHFATDVQGAEALLSQADVKRRLIITFVPDLKDLRNVLADLDQDSTADYVIVVGPQAEDDVTLSALLQGSRRRHDGEN